MKLLRIRAHNKVPKVAADSKGSFVVLEVVVEMVGFKLSKIVENGASMMKVEVDEIVTHITENKTGRHPVRPKGGLRVSHKY